MELFMKYTEEEMEFLSSLTDIKPQKLFFPEIFDNLKLNNLVKEYKEISLQKGEKLNYDGIIFVNEGILGLYENGKVTQIPKNHTSGIKHMFASKLKTYVSLTQCEIIKFKVDENSKEFSIFLKNVLKLLSKNIKENF